MARLPAADPAPPDGRLPESALEGGRSRPLGIYVHVRTVVREPA